MRFVFFGASVTRQSIARDGNITGYINHLESIFKQSGYSIECLRHAFGSCLFSNMGRYGFLSALNQSSSLLFFEWHTTGETYHDLNVWISLLEACLQRQVLPVILVLPRLNAINDSQKYQILPHLEKLAIVYDMRNIDKANYYRDSVHTTPAGAKALAQEIFTMITKDNLLGFWQNIISNYQYEVKMVNFTRKPVRFRYQELGSGNGVKIYRNNSMIFSCSRVTDLGFWGIKDQYTVDCELRAIPGRRTIIREVVDQWCYYKRETLMMSVEMEDRSFGLRVLNACPLYSARCPYLRDLYLDDPDSVQQDRQRIWLLGLYVDIYAQVSYHYI